MELNAAKTKVMIVTKKNKELKPSLNISVNDVKLEQVQKLKYLGTTLNWDARDEVEIQMRIALARKAFNDMRSFLWNKNISFTCLLCYLNFEMRCIRRMQRVSWTQRKTREHVLRSSNITRFLLKSVRKRQLNFLGHVMRKNQLEHLSLTGKIAGRKSL